MGSVWFVVDGEVVFSCAGGSVKARNVARDPRAVLCVDDEWLVRLSPERILARAEIAL